MQRGTGEKSSSFYYNYYCLKRFRGDGNAFEIEIRACNYDYNYCRVCVYVLKFKTVSRYSVAIGIAGPTTFNAISTRVLSGLLNLNMSASAGYTV